MVAALREPELDRLIATANESNQTLRQAVAARRSGAGAGAGGGQLPLSDDLARSDASRVSAPPATAASTITGQPVAQRGHDQRLAGAVRSDLRGRRLGPRPRSLEVGASAGRAPAPTTRRWSGSTVADRRRAVLLHAPVARRPGRNPGRRPLRLVSASRCAALGPGQERAGRAPIVLHQAEAQLESTLAQQRDSSAPAPTRSTRWPFSAASPRRRSPSPPTAARGRAARRAAGPAGGAARAPAGRGRGRAERRRRQRAGRRGDRRLLSAVLA